MNTKIIELLKRNSELDKESEQKADQLVQEAEAINNEIQEAL